MPDHISRFVADAEGLAISVVRAPATCELIGHQQHGLVDRPLRALGHAILSSLLLATRLKGRGLLSWTVDTDGCFDLLRADAIGLGSIRALVRPATSERLSDWNGFDPLFGRGRLLVSKRIEGGQAYQTILAIDGGSMVEITNTYLRDSEQVTAGVMHDIICEAGQVSRATGIYVECLPDRAEPALPPAIDEILRGSALTWDCAETDDAALVAQILGCSSCRLLHQYPVGFHCPCSRQRYIDTLRAFSLQDKTSLTGSDGVILTTCDFCRSQYSIPLDEIV